MTRHAPTDLYNDRGSAMITAIIVLPLLVLMMSFVIDVGSWFVHKRHLQTQADAAVLAAAGQVTIPCADAPVIGRANQYGGLAAYAGAGPFNTQIGGTPASKIHGLLNSATFYGQGSPTDPDVATGGPCATGMIDLKLTESESKVFWPLYESYQADQDKLDDRLIAIIQEYAKNYKTMTDAAALDIITQRTNLDLERTKLVQSYLPKFSAVLPGIKTARYYQVEYRIRLLLSLDLAKQMPMVENPASQP